MHAHEHAARHLPDPDPHRRPGRGPRPGFRDPEAPFVAAGGLSAGGHPGGAAFAGLRGRRGAGLAAGRDRHHPAHVRRGPAFPPQGPAGRARHRPGRGRGADHAHDPFLHVPAPVLGLLPLGGRGLRHVGLRGEHGGAHPRPGRQSCAAHPHRPCGPGLAGGGRPVHHPTAGAPARGPGRRRRQHLVDTGQDPAQAGRAHGLHPRGRTAPDPRPAGLCGAHGHPRPVHAGGHRAGPGHRRGLGPVLRRVHGLRGLPGGHGGGAVRFQRPRHRRGPAPT